MKKILFGLILGILVTMIGDFVRLYEDRTIRTYQKSECVDKGIEPNKCYFHLYFDPYIENHKTLNTIAKYFLFGEGQFYYIVSSKCSNQMFINPSATPNSGKITKREYFFGKCTRFAIAISDILYGP